VGQRSEELATQFEQAVAEFADLIQKYPDDRWAAAQGPEGWPVAAIAQHVSGQFPLEMEFITAAAEGRDLPGYSWNDIDGKNNSRAAANMNATKDAVLRELREGAASTAAYIRGLSDEQLDRAGKLALANNAEVTTQQLIEGGVLIDHVRGHMQSINSAG
jgi:DinB superfamily